MTSNKIATFEVDDRHLEVAMSGDDYDVCTKLLRRLLYAELIHGYWWHEETSTAYIHYSAKAEDERLPSDDDEARGNKETSNLQSESGQL
jgi:hypothetical protein